MMILLDWRFHLIYLLAWMIWRIARPIIRELKRADDEALQERILADVQRLQQQRDAGIRALQARDDMMRWSNMTNGHPEGCSFNAQTRRWTSIADGCVLTHPRADA